MNIPIFKIHIDEIPSIVSKVYVNKKPWTSFSILSVLVASWMVAVFLHWETVMSMVDTWSHSDTFAHGFVILPISLYLIWTRRRQFVAINLTPKPWGLLLLMGLNVLWFLGEVMAIRVVKQLAVVGMFSGLVWTIFGTALFRTILFPLAFLVFSVPIGEGLVSPLQDFTAVFTVKALEFSGIPVLWEGRFLSIPNGMWHVAEACAGVRYIIPSLALGFLFAGMIYRSWTRRIFFMVAAFLVPIFANGFRAYGTLLLAYVSNNMLAKGLEHFIGGWLFFGLVMFVLFSFGLLWREAGRPSLEQNDQPVQAIRELGIPKEAIRDGDRQSLTKIGLVAVAGLLVLALAPLVGPKTSNYSKSSAILHPIVPVVKFPWERMEEYTGKWVPIFRGADVELIQSYRHDSRTVHLYLAYYTHSRQGAELINQMNTLVDDKDWIIQAEGKRKVYVDGESLEIQESLIRSRATTRVVWSWYWVGGEFSSNLYVGKYLQAKALLFGKEQEGAMIALATDFEDYADETVNPLQDFLQHTSFLTTFKHS